MTKLYSRHAENAVKISIKGKKLIDTMRYSYGSFSLHSVLLQQTQMPSFKLIRLEMAKLCPGVELF